MKSSYNQSKALLAITKASLLAILKNPSALFFSLGFPLIFVWIFGSFGGGSGPQFKVALNTGSDTNNMLYHVIKSVPLFEMSNYTDTALRRTDLEKGRLDALIKIIPVNDTVFHQKRFLLQLTSTSASERELAQMIPILENISSKLEAKQTPALVTIEKQVYEVREYKQIDFVLPGQIGFSILFSTLFGIAFTFYNLREQLVLKRFYATPVNKLSILIGIGFSRIAFQLINVIVLLLVGKFALGFTLAHGAATFFEIIILSILMLLVLMGVGLIFSSIVKQDSTIPLFINLFALPQMLLSGTFFPISVFPSWMQILCKLMPLTHFNLAMRKLSFEGLSLLNCWDNIAVISAWGIIVYFIVYKVFRWE